MFDALALLMHTRYHPPQKYRNPPKYSLLWLFRVGSIEWYSIRRKSPIKTLQTNKPSKHVDDTASLTSAPRFAITNQICVVIVCVHKMDEFLSKFICSFPIRCDCI